MESQNLTQWNEWYRLARSALGYQPEEAAEYANLRIVEEQNREILRGSTANPAHGKFAHRTP